MLLALALTGLIFRAAGQGTGEEELPLNDRRVADTSWLQPLPAEIGDGVEGVLYERWDDVPGNSVRSLTRSEKFGAPADSKGLLQSLEPPANDGKSYGVRMRGYFVAPRSGKMQLVISSDDNSELWLSRGKDPFARTRVAWIAGDGRYGYSKPHETGPSKSQRAVPVEVEQGKWYYFEAYHKERSGDDHFSVRWRFDDEKETSVIPASALRPWTPTAQDANDDGLPDSWQQETGLNGSEEPDSWGDPDHDGVVNFDEYIAGTNPTDGEGVNGFLLWESWYGIEGADVADLVRSPSFTGDPDSIQFLHGSATPEIGTGNYGSRLSGFIVPQESGDYELAITGDESAELWLSDGPSSLNKQRVAFNDHWRKKGQWQVVPSQVAKVVHMDAGQSYYVEILHKDSGSPGWVALGWRKQGEESFAEITPPFLRSPGTEAWHAKQEVVQALSAGATFSRMDAQTRGSVAFTEHGDADHDGIPNWLEVQRGSDALSGDKIPGVLTREWWFNVPGQSLSKARDAGAFLPRPSMVTLSDGTEPKNTTDWFVSRYRGSLVPPVSGTYKFWISGDDHCELWLSSNDKKYYKKRIAMVAPEVWEKPDTEVWTDPQEWDESANQESAAIVLEAGRSYFIEILHKDASGPDHVNIAWQHKAAGGQAWSDRTVVEASALSSHEGDLDDLDDDYLPDSWESQYGLDPGDNGLKDRAKQGEAGDFDSDGLNNREEFLLGSNPCLADSDGDGVGDYDEVKTYGSNPVVRDASPPVKQVQIPLAEYQSVPGRWTTTPDGNLKSMSRKGTVDFSFDLDQPGIYMVELQASSHVAGDYAPPVPVIGRVDGIEVGRGEIDRNSAVHRWLTPWLAAGSHTVTIDNRNVRSGVTIEISSLAIYRHEGEDADGNSIPDWMEALFRSLNGTDAASLESAVSPLCLEGSERIPGSTTVIAGEESVETLAALSGHWFANVPLSATASTSVSVDYENGSLRSEQTLVWTATNLFEAPDTLRVRVGDSLKLTAIPSGTDGSGTSARYTLAGALFAEGNAAEPRTISFEEAGTFEIAVATVSGTETLNAKIEVQVISADFGPAFSVASGKTRTWGLPGIPRGVAIESDPKLTLEEVPREASQSRRFSARYPAGESGNPHVVARLWDSGPILATTTVNAFRVAAASETVSTWMLSILPDGTKIIEFLIAIDGPIPSDLSIWLDFYVTDAVFEDGSSRYQLTAADFDENGIAKILVYKAPGSGNETCHWVLPYDGEDLDSPEGE